MSIFDQQRERLAYNKAQVARFDEGTDPDLPDDPELRKYLRRYHAAAAEAGEKVIADMIRLGVDGSRTEDFV